MVPVAGPGGKAIQYCNNGYRRSVAMQDLSISAGTSTPVRTRVVRYNWIAAAVVATTCQHRHVVPVLEPVGGRPCPRSTAAGTVL